MVNYEQGLPNILFKSTLVLELIAFLSSHLIDNRNEPTLHEGLLSRCIYPKKLGEGMGLEYHCLWWSFDTFMTDRGSLQFVTLLAFLSIFLLGFTVIYVVWTHFNKDLRSTYYNSYMSFISMGNFVILLLVILIYTFGYASNTSILRKAMSCVVDSLSFIFLLASIGAEAISLLSSYMVVNRFAPGLHDGIFQRCGAINFFQSPLNAVGSFITKTLDGSVKTFTYCYWWSSSLFDKDEPSLQVVVILSFVSISLISLAFIFFLISLIDKFKAKSLNIFLGLLMMTNALVLVGIILIYTFLYAKDAKISLDSASPLLFSWSYWILYGATTGNFLTGVLFCFNPTRNVR